MHTLIYLNNRVVNAARARVAFNPGALLYGRGVFTTLAVHHARPFLWPEHYARLQEHAERTGIEAVEFSEASIGAALAELIEANEIAEGRARVSLLTSAEAVIWQTSAGDAKQKTRLLIITGERRAACEEGVAITVSPYRVNTLSPLTGIKSVNYLDHILSWEEARGRDFDEAVVLNERGEVVSTTLANLFWVRDGHLHTPALSTGALAGTTRALVIRLAGELSMPFVESVNDLAPLAEADEIFLTSAGLGLQFVNAFDYHRYTITVGSLAVRLREALRQFTLQAS
ncbi:MAG: aminotransferase class IV [Pyrinomonadaceae bacterium]